MKSYTVKFEIDPVTVDAENAEEALNVVENRLIDAGFTISDSYVDEEWEEE